MKNPLIHIFVAILIATVVLSKSNYKVVSFQNTSSTLTMGLRYTGSDDYYIKPTSPIIKDLTFTFHVYTFNDFDIKIVDAKNQRFEVPQ